MKKSLLAIVLGFALTACSTQPKSIEKWDNFERSSAKTEAVKENYSRVTFYRANDIKGPVVNIHVNGRYQASVLAELLSKLSLCLQWLDGLDLNGKTVIDFGCGSGILAIAALKLGAKQAIGIDIDPQAILASQNNAEANGVADRLQLFLAKDQPKDLQADVVVANILAGPLKELAPNIITLVKLQGDLGLSGILSTQAASVCKAYQGDFTLDPVAEKEEWCRITGVKNKNA